MNQDIKKTNQARGKKIEPEIENLLKKIKEWDREKFLEKVSKKKMDGN